MTDITTWEPLHNNLGDLENNYVENLGTLGEAFNTKLGTLTTFTWETWESWGNRYNATSESLRKPWQYNLGTLENLYNVTLGTLREPLHCNLGKLEETLTI